MHRYFIETLARNGEVEQRQAFASLPIRLGRAYDNDFILDDEHSAPHHAQIALDQDGQIFIHDLGSKNGISVEHRKCERAHLKGDERIRLGQTLLRVRRSDYQVEPEQTDTNNYHWEGWRPASTGIAMMSLIAIASTWINQFEAFSFISYLQSILSFVLVMIVWSGLWAAANRLLARQTRFGRHIFIASCAFLSLQIWESLSGLLGFMFSWEFLSHYANHVEFYILILGMYFHAITVSKKNARGIRIIAFAVAAFSSSFSLMSHHKNTGSYQDEMYLADLYPSSLKLSKSVSVEQLTLATGKLQAELDAERKIIAPSSELDDEE